ncbi:cytochrome P450 [Streptomyces spectabilis]|nr:cytochrome P450 [Streptomyces spectabilis]
MTQSGNFRKGEQFEKLRPLIGNGLASAEGELHRRQRCLMRPAFHKSRFPFYFEVIRDVTRAHSARWREGKQLLLDRAMYQLSAAIATRLLFNSPITDRTASVIEEAGLCVVRGLGKKVIAPFGFAEHLPTSANRDYEAAMRRLHTVVGDVIQTRRQEGIDYGDLLSILLTAVDPDTGAMTDQQVHDEVMTMLGGATESTAVTLSWALFEIDRHPEVENQVMSELAALSEISLESLGELTFLQRVVDETLRIRGPAWILTRRAAKDVRLGAARLSAGTSIWYSPYLLHHDPRLYPHPERFDPGRWLNTHPTSRECTFIPFGAGMRSCVGEQLARMEVLTVLATILQDWRLPTRPNVTVRPVPGFVLAPGALPVIPTRRSGRSRYPVRTP